MNIYLKKVFTTGRFLIRTAIIWIGEILGLYLLANLSIGLTIDNIATAALVIVILEVINALFWPIIARILLPFLVYTIGIGSLLLNALIIWGISLFIPHLTISGYGLILVPLGIAGIHTLLTTLLTLDSENSYYNFIIRKKKRRNLDDAIIVNNESIHDINNRNRENIRNNENNESIHDIDNKNSENIGNNENNENIQNIRKNANTKNTENIENIENNPLEHVNNKNNTIYTTITTSNEYKNKNNECEDFGLIIIEIDGLAKDILEEAIEKGYMPTLASWKYLGTHRIKEWETDLSSQTGSSQAGILHGNNEDIVAFRWVEKENNNKIMVSTGLRDAPKIEKRISNGKGLLYKNGSSHSNLFSGDTDNVLFTYSKMHDIRKFYNRTWYYVYSNPANFGRILLLCASDTLREFSSQIKHKIKNINPRIRKSFIYYFVRACANVYMREINTQTIIGDMVRGKVDIIYSTYLGYDEIAHHSGIRDKDAFYSLKGLDRQIKRIAGANKYSKKPYEIVIQSDHGQSNGATFKQRYGLSLKDLVHNLLPEDMKIYGELYSNEDHFSQAITFPIEDFKERFKDKNIFAKNRYDEFSTRIISKRDNILEYVKKHNIPKVKSEKKMKNNLDDAEVIVLASGNLGLIYLTQWEDRLDYETIRTLFPELIPGLVQHEGIGFILINSKEHGALAIGKEGVYYLEKNIIDGKNPLSGFGKNAAKHLLRTNNFKHTPDILVNSFYDEDSDEVAAFEELIGSHGGLGGTQSKPFIMYPNSWKIDDEEIIGAESIHKIIKENFKNYSTHK